MHICIHARNNQTTHRGEDQGGATKEIKERSPREARSKSTEGLQSDHFRRGWGRGRTAKEEKEEAEQALEQICSLQSFDGPSPHPPARPSMDSGTFQKEACVYWCVRAYM